MRIAFPAGEQTVLRRHCVAFPAEYGGRRIVCRISFSALMEFPDAVLRHHLTTFRAFREEIEARAIARIRAGNWDGADVSLG